MSWQRLGFGVALAAVALAGLALLWSGRDSPGTLTADPGSDAIPAVDDPVPDASDEESNTSTSTSTTTPTDDSGSSSTSVTTTELPTTTAPEPAPIDCTPFTTEIGNDQTTLVTPCTTTTIDQCDPNVVSTTSTTTADPACTTTTGP